MAAPSVTNNFVNNTTADGPAVSANFSDLVNFLANRNDGSASWDRCLVTSSSAVALIANNSTGTSNIANFQDNGSNVFQIVDGGDLYMNSAKKFYFDGGGDTYITESTANLIDLAAGGTVLLRIDGTNSLVKALNADLVFPSLKKLYLDGGSDTYVTESAANQIDIYAGGTLHARINDTGSLFGVLGTDFAIPSLKNLYVDGGGDTYITESTANTMDFATAGTLALRITSGQILDYRLAAIAVGGGAAATLGTIGGSGPATSTMNSWIKVKIAGVDSYIPIWR